MMRLWAGLPTGAEDRIKAALTGQKKKKKTHDTRLYRVGTALLCPKNTF